MSSVIRIGRAFAASGPTHSSLLSLGKEDGHGIA